jgi:hypothetical protein
MWRMATGAARRQLLANVVVSQSDLEIETDVQYHRGYDP